MSVGLLAFRPQHLGAARWWLIFVFAALWVMLAAVTGWLIRQEVRSYRASTPIKDETVSARVPSVRRSSQARRAPGVVRRLRDRR